MWGHTKTAIGKSIIHLGDGGLAGYEVEIIRVKKDINPKYLNYCLSSKHSRIQIENHSQLRTVFHIYTKYIKLIKIPVPNLEEQNRFVEILDCLYAITHDLEEEIPALIRKNREQYNFYKELLVNPV